MNRTVQLASVRPLAPTTILARFLQPALWERITTITGSQTVETTTVTETRNSSDNTAAIPISAGILLVAGAIVFIILLKRISVPS